MNLPTSLRGQRDFFPCALFPGEGGGGGSVSVRHVTKQATLTIHSTGARSYIAPVIYRTKCHSINVHVHVSFMEIIVQLGSQRNLYKFIAFCNAIHQRIFFIHTEL